MKQAQNAIAQSPKKRWTQPGRLSESFCYPAYAQTVPGRPGRASLQLTIRLVGAIFRLFWSIISLPFRLLVGVMGLLGRLTGILLGFATMVVGMALWAGPLFMIGIPLFIIGLLLTLRCLD